MKVIRTETDRVLISEGLEPGERVCITNLAAAIDQMKVRIKDEDENEDDAEEKQEPESATELGQPEEEPES